MITTWNLFQAIFSIKSYKIIWTCEPNIRKFYFLVWVPVPKNVVSFTCRDDLKIPFDFDSVKHVITEYVLGGIKIFLFVPSMPEYPQ